MIGNDIVDIATAQRESNWQRPRFLQKLFTENEQQIILNSEDSLISVWRFWSMKEAAYKLYTQLNPSRFYSPKKFECIFKNGYTTVKFQDFECYVETKINSDYIISEASLKPLKLKSEIIRFETENIKSSSLILKEKLMNSVAKNFRISKDKFALKKDDFGIPTIDFQNNKIYVSLTHHGRFGAFAIT